MSGCRKFVEIPPPSTVIVTASVFNNDGAAHAALASIYADFFATNMSYTVSSQMGLLADELSNLNDPFISFYQNAVLPSNTSSLWNVAYTLIYEANAVVEGLSGYTGVTPQIAQQLTGEAEFVRAFCHFYLVNAFGDVPLVTSTDYTVNARVARTPKDQVYKQIISDLLSAGQLLNVNYVNKSDTASTSERARPNKATASALLARVYLYAGKYDSAEIFATSVINDARFSLNTDLNNVFQSDNSEAIWQVKTITPDPGYPTADGNNYILVAATGAANMLITPWLLSSFEPGDVRMANWISSYTDGTSTWYFPYKYQVHDNANNPNNRAEAVMILRLGEQYLIRSESRAQQNNISGALDDLNIIRHRAGLGDYGGATDQASMLAGILHERQVELFCEWGNRWFDLIRTGNVNAVMGTPGNICQQKGGIWNPDGYQALLPIAQSEILTNHNLVQNSGY